MGWETGSSVSAYPFESWQRIDAPDNSPSFSSSILVQRLKSPLQLTSVNSDSAASITILLSHSRRAKSAAALHKCSLCRERFV